MGVQINGDTGNVIATKGTFSGDVGIGGTLTYEDVTNIDSVGLITARQGIKIGTGVGVAASISVDGNAEFAGIVTASTSVKVGGGVTISESGIEASGIGITVANINGAQIGGRRNIIINGAMQVAQRGTSFTNISDTGVIGSVDRIVMVGANLDELAFAGKQTSDGPDGFSKCFEFDVTTAENALDANDLAYIRYKIEGQDLVQLFNANGTGRDFTLSFYVKAYQAGTYQLNIYKNQGPRFISKTYTVDASATWQRVVIPFTGDTGTTGMNDDNGNGFQIAWMLVAGTDYTSGSLQPTWGGWPGNSGFAAGHAVNVASSADNYFRITGIQLELGSQATAFEHRSFGEELELCRRYFQIIGPSSGEAQNSTNIQGSLQATPFMRTNPSIAIIDNSNNVGLAGVGGNSVTSVGTIYTESESSGMGGWVEMGGSGFTQHRFYHIYGGKFSFSAEL